MILLIYTIFTVIAGSGGDSSDDDETPTIDINALNAEILNEDDKIHQMQNGTIDDVIAAGKTSTYSSAIKSISNWFFNVLNNEDRTKYQNVLQVSPEAATLKKKVIKGIRKQTGKFKNLKGIESNAKSPIPWEV